MTTDELVRNIIRDYNDNEIGIKVLGVYRDFIRPVQGSNVIYSVALNDETRDIRYVRLPVDDEAHEVTPNTVLRTEYTKV